jgi:uncharacterized protein (TIGR02118 family)
MLKACVIYLGQPEDPAAFDAYYWNTHLPIAAKIPGLKRLVVNKAKPGEGEFYQIAELYFEDRAALERGLASPERQAAADDVKRFPTFAGDIKRGVFEVREFPLG